MFFKLVSAAEVLPLRQDILRPGKPIESCSFENDNTESTQHLGAFFKDKLVGILSLFVAKNQIFDAPKQIQLRGMAIDIAYQKQGIGKSLLQETLKRKKPDDLIWCHARLSAVDFYQKNGFQKASNSFDISGVGPHIVMYYNQS